MLAVIANDKNNGLSYRSMPHTHVIVPAAAMLSGELYATSCRPLPLRQKTDVWKAPCKCGLIRQRRPTWVAVLLLGRGRHAGVSRRLAALALVKLALLVGGGAEVDDSVQDLGGAPGCTALGNGSRGRRKVADLGRHDGR